MIQLAGVPLTRVDQGRNQCGQACVADLLGIDLVDAVKLVGRRGCTRARHLDAGLRRHGLSLGARRVGPPPVHRYGKWLVAVHLEPHSRKWHWAVLRLGKFVVIVWPTRERAANAWDKGWKITSSYEVLGPR